MNQFEELTDAYSAIWNETDDQRRRALIERTWTEDATYVDPLVRAEGHDGIDATIGAAQKQFPGCRFSRSGDIDGYNDRVRFKWELGPQGGPSVAGGTDVGLIVDGRWKAITGFLDFARLQGS